MRDELIFSANRMPLQAANAGFSLEGDSRVWPYGHLYFSSLATTLSNGRHSEDDRRLGL